MIPAQERDHLTRIAAQAADLDGDDIAEAIDQLQNEIGFCVSIKNKLESELVRRMMQDDRKLVVGQKYRQDYEVEPVYRWSFALLEKELKPRLTAEDWKKLYDLPDPVPPVPKVKTGSVLALAKRLGPEERKIIDRAAGKTEKNPRVKLTRLEPEIGVLE